MATTITTMAPISASHPDSASLRAAVSNPPKQNRGIFTELFAHLARMRYFCGALHLNRATVSPTASAAGFFYGRGVCHNTTSSVPCGALMRPLPGSRCNATGSGTFFVALLEEISTQSHSLNKLSKMNTSPRCARPGLMTRQHCFTKFSRHPRLPRRGRFLFYA